MNKVFINSIFICLTLNTFGQLSSEKLFKSFKQGERTNCASIALIKASLEVYGLNNLFVVTSETNDSIKVTLKDKSRVLLSKNEIK
jgi:hypothetical protein